MVACNRYLILFKGHERALECCSITEYLHVGQSGHSLTNELDAVFLINLLYIFIIRWSNIDVLHELGHCRNGITASLVKDSVAVGIVHPASPSFRFQETPHASKS